MEWMNVQIYDFNKIFCCCCNVRKMSQYTIIDKKYSFMVAEQHNKLYIERQTSTFTIVCKSYIR